MWRWRITRRSDLGRIMFAGAKKIDNLILTVDANKQQICGSTDEILNLGDLNQKITAFNWEVIEVSNGNDLKSVIQGIEEAKDKIKKETHLYTFEYRNGVRCGFYDGVSSKWHGIAPNDNELKKALSQLEETIGDY